MDIFDSTITSFEDFPSERFKEQLESLTYESIERASQFVLENLPCIDDLFDVLLNRMRKVKYL
ncbi:hypothetical protein DDB_G0281731 [Dictyostelium discoideum AX4]|uniref:hypothetical protein n=1 Tax=Dictyostelium discoideum AX4 TaxID=352472 RepID=UPI00004E376C|nr:hypothetical protein DDB_G0281731 [Dictyostelium discoideum AX4]EAL66627.1 hypothetical protein DDB_G0281731 [Dictyostelium discoideum AX4]|eukprot:XP_640608.1 hypothetical protein DDB_G0281731 [Dictyostelium discoideum AX4]